MEKRGKTMNNPELIKKEKYDVIVVGGGIAGISAAVSAARCGMKVLLIEKLVNLGGLATEGLISFYEPLCDGLGKQLITGIAEELIKLSYKYSFDNLSDDWKNKSPSPKGRYETFYSPTVFSIALDRYVLDNGVELLFDTLATYPVMEKNRCTGIIAETVEGRIFFECSVVIDATGSATVMHRAGVPTIEGENFMSYVTHGYETHTLQSTSNPCDIRKWNWIAGGDDLPSDNHLKCISAKDITNYVVYGKMHLLEEIKKNKRDSYDIMTLPSMAQFRKIRRIVGKTNFNAIDGETFAHSIGDCGDWRLNIPHGKHYQIPMGALYNRSFENLIAAGRIISAHENDGWEIARVIPTCALTGEAAGKMAALSVKNSCSVFDVEEKHYKEFEAL